MKLAVFAKMNTAPWCIVIETDIIRHVCDKQRQKWAQRSMNNHKWTSAVKYFVWVDAFEFAGSCSLDFVFELILSLRTGNLRASLTDPFLQILWLWQLQELDRLLNH